MDSNELSRLLQTMGAPSEAYSIGSDRNESYCMVFDQQRWHVYYSERGNRNDERILVSEAQACQELLNMLLRDGIVRSVIEDR
jgi:hypothetical protein